MSCDIAIIGGGVIGLACAWRLAQGGARVHLFERDDFGRQASWAAAGMLAAQCEAAHHPPAAERSTAAAAMLDLCLQSRALYPAFAAELLDATGHDIELSLNGAPTHDERRPGILYVAAPDDPAPARFAEQMRAGHRVGEVASAEAAALLNLEESFAPRGRCFWLEDEGQVENRRLAHALELAARGAGAVLHTHSAVRRVVVQNGRVTKLVTENGEIVCDRVLLCAGAWSRQLPGLPPECAPPVRPVAGQMLMVRPPRRLRSTLYSTSVYLVPRRDGRLLVGATVEEIGFRAATTATAARRLREAAIAMAPQLAACEIEEHWFGLRPGSPDGLPILGRTRLANLFVATGHYRNGILLTPATAQLMAGQLLQGNEPPAAFHPERFN